MSNSGGFEDVILANARSARELMGVATVSPPAASDAAFALRRAALLRSLYPHAAPPLAAAPQPRSSDGGKEDGQTTHASGQRPDGSTALAVVAVPHQGTSSAVGGSGPSAFASAGPDAESLLGRKRTRDVDSVTGAEAAETPILTVNPQTLRNEHALAVASSSRAAVADASSSSAVALAGSGSAAETRTAPAYTPPPQWKLSKVLVGHQGWVWAAAVDPTNTWFATGAFDAVIKVWDLSSGALKLNLTGHKEAVRALALSQVSPYLYSGSDDHAVKCWDLERNEVVREFFGHQSAVHCLSAHPALDVVFSGGRDNTVRVWDVRSRACVHILKGHTDSVMSLVSQQSDPQVISGGSDGMVYLWDLRAGQPLTRLTRHKKPVRGLALSQSGGQLVSCGADEVRVWRLPNGDYECNASTILDKSAGSKAAYTGAALGEEELAYRWSCCAMSPRSVLAVASQDGHLGLYDWNRPQGRAQAAKFYCPYQLARTRSVPGTLAGEGGINAVVFDASGTRLITAESDKSVKIWRLREA